jgi:medium-chain acyl-[acyl-carrier-protein] hydrolase
MEKSKVGRYKFLAEPFHVDLNGELPIDLLGNSLINTADFHSDPRGFGVTFLKEKNCTWVLSRLAVEINRPPRIYEKFQIETWCEKIYRFFTDRNFIIYGEDGEKIGYARSVWAVINLTTRKPLDLLSLESGHLADYIETEMQCPIEKPSRIKLHEGEMVRQYKAQYSDIDINGHFNSIKYMQHILDLFPAERYRKQHVQRFEIAYVAESTENDTLSFYKEEVNENNINIEVKRKDEVACRCKIIFKDK